MTIMWTAMRAAILAITAGAGCLLIGLQAMESTEQKATESKVVESKATPLKPGLKAPEFSALDQDGKTVVLAQYLGKKTVVLYFYPKDDTPGCTAEACSLRDGHQAILEAGAVVLGVSADDVSSHKSFSQKFSLPFPILADPERKIIKAYGVRMAVVGLAKRVTFIIDAKGMIRDIIWDVKTKTHDQQVIASLHSIR